MSAGGTQSLKISPSSALFAMDIVLVAALWPLTLWITAKDATTLWLPALILAVFNQIFLYALGLYRREAVMSTATSLQRIPLVVALGVVAAGIVISIFRSAAPTTIISTTDDTIFVTAMLCFTICAATTRLIFRSLRRHPVFRPRLLIIGAGQRAWDLAWVLRNQGRSLRYDVTFAHSDVFGPIDPRLEADPANRIETLSEEPLTLARHVGADQIVVAPDERRGMSLEALIPCKTAGYPVLQYMSFLEREVGRIDIKRLDMTWLLFSEGFSYGPLDRGLKRIVDIATSLLILTPFSPILLLAMLAIWLDDPGPVIYRQERVTRGGRHFQICKLRTMRQDAEKHGAVWAAAKDNRITRAGSFLRRTRLDELPQLYNVLKGDMSLVGPRPERPQFVEQLAKELPLYHERHAVKAGLTGWAQINYPYGASVDDARSKLSYDLYYVKNANVLFDIMIIMQTLRVVIWPGNDVR